VTQTPQLIRALKKALKAHGKTYADVAAHLDLSEASIKRLFSANQFTLQRLEQVCALIDLSLTDLVAQMQSEGAQPLRVLSEAQEAELVADVERLLVTVCVLNRWGLDDLLAHFQLDYHRAIRHLAHLDRLRLIELLPGDRIKLRVDPNFKWRDNGPIQRFFQEKVEADFFHSRFDGPGERLIVINGMLAEGTRALFERKLEVLAREFEQLNRADATLPIDEKNGATVVLATRPWGYGLFGALRRKEKD